MIVDGPRDDIGLDVGGIARGIGLAGHRGPCEADPELGALQAAAGAFDAGDRRIARERQTVERQRMQPQVRPCETRVDAAQAERPVLFGIEGQRLQRLADLRRVHAAKERDRAEMMSMEPFGESSEDRLCGIGRNALDDELTARDTKGHLRPIDEQVRRARRDGLSRRFERRVPVRVHAVLVQRDREFDQEIAVLPRQRSAVGTGCVGHPVRRVVHPSSASKASLYCFVHMSPAPPRPIRSILLVIWTILAGATSAAAQSATSTARPAPCADAVECRRLAFEAEASGDFERFHDLAWRAVQISRTNDSSLMYQLARAQVLSGRPHDALVMVRRLAEMGVATDAATSDEFARTRALPEWPEVAERMARVPTPVIIPLPSTAAVATSPRAAAPSSSGIPPPASSSVPERASAKTVPSAAAPPTPAARASRASRRESSAVAPLPPAAPAAAAGVAIALPFTPFPLKPANADEAARFSSAQFSSGGLAYDTVSQRFVIGEALGRKLMVVGLGASQPTDMVREDSAGFQDVTAVEIDERRGDLWVASMADGPGGAVHRLQLVSGRPLRTYRGVPAQGTIHAVDLAITPAGTVLVLDTGGGRILSIARGATEMKVAMAITTRAPSSIATTEEEGVVYVTHADGISRVDLRSQATSVVSSNRGFDLTRFERLRSHRGALVGLQALPEGSLQVVRLELSSNGRTITDAAAINVATDAVDAAAVPTSPPGGPAGRRPFLTISGDEMYYLAAPTEPDPAAAIVIRRVHLR